MCAPGDTRTYRLGRPFTVSNGCEKAPEQPLLHGQPEPIPFIRYRALKQRHVTATATWMRRLRASQGVSHQLPDMNAAVEPQSGNDLGSPPSPLSLRSQMPAYPHAPMPAHRFPPPLPGTQKPLAVPALTCA